MDKFTIKKIPNSELENGNYIRVSYDVFYGENLVSTYCQFQDKDPPRPEEYKAAMKEALILSIQDELEKALSEIEVIDSNTPTA